MKETIDAIGTNLMLLVGLGLMGFVAYIQHREHMAMLRRLEDRLLLSQPITTAPKDRKILVKHNRWGWIEVVHYADDSWDDQVNGPWLYTEDLVAWAELPEEQI